jgi:hypothetical protein
MEQILRDLAAGMFYQDASLTMVSQIQRLAELSITASSEVLIVLQEYERLQIAAAVGMNNSAIV